MTSQQRLPLDQVLIGMLVVICLMITTESAYAVTPVVDKVTVIPNEAGTAIRFDFNTPLRYVAHAPAARGNLLQIELNSISSALDDTELEQRQLLRWSTDTTTSLAEIIYEGNGPKSARLLIRFKEQTTFTIENIADPRQLTINLLTGFDAEDLNKNRIAINLESNLERIDITKTPKLQAFEKYQLYTTQSKVSGKLWHRLRLGFFGSRQEAEQVLAGVIKDFPTSWITKAPRSDKRAAAIAALDATPLSATEKKQPVAADLPPAAVGQPEPAETEPVVTEPAAKPTALPDVEEKTPSTSTAQIKAKGLTAEKKQRLLNDGEASMIAGDFSRAALIYTRLVELADAATSQQALEYLGLARERNNQLAHAKAEYENYLTLYPEGEGAGRVKQRLAGVITARATPKKKLRRAKTAEGAPKWRHEVYGSFSQFYDRDVTYTNNEDAVVNRSDLSTDIDLNARSRSKDYDLRATFVGGYKNTFLEDDNSEERISSLYVDALAHKLKLSTRVGRQSRSTGGVLGRFDGGLISWQAFDKASVTLVGGFPVESSKEIEIDTSRPLYGISFDLGTFADRWDFNAFYISQNVDGISDREAVGGEVRYFHPDFSFFSLVDYDIIYNELNTLLFNGNWSVTDKTIINVSADYRQSPTLTTSNALQGQTATTIDALLKIFSEDEIRQLARDRTATSRSYTLGVTHSLSEKLQISGDLTLSEFSGTPTSGGVEGFNGTGYDYFYSLQFIGSSLIKEGDIAIIGLRYSDTSTSSTYSANINTRYPVTRNLRLNPRFLVDYRINNNGSGEQLKFRPLLRVEYRWKRRYHFEFEGGLEWSTETISGFEDDRRGYFFTAGYRIDF